METEAKTGITEPNKVPTTTRRQKRKQQAAPQGRSIALPVLRFQTSGLQNCERINFETTCYGSLRNSCTFPLSFYSTVGMDQVSLQTASYRALEVGRSPLGVSSFSTTSPRLGLREKGEAQAASWHHSFLLRICFSSEEWKRWPTLSRAGQAFHPALHHKFFLPVPYSKTPCSVLCLCLASAGSPGSRELCFLSLIVGVTDFYPSLSLLHLFKCPSFHSGVHLRNVLQVRLTPASALGGCSNWCHGISPTWSRTQA